jgi:hypothetical protein
MEQAPNPFRYFHSSPEVFRLVVLMYVRFPLSLRNVEDLLHERGIDLCYETVRLWWNRFGSLFTADIRRQRVSRTRGLGIGNGTSTRSTFGSMGRCTIYGVRWTMKVRSWKAT